MSTYTQILYQIVFGSKSYTSFLTKQNRDILYNYIVGILHNKECHSYIVSGYGNHIHIATHIHPTVTLASLVKDIKRASTEMIIREKSNFMNFGGWQVGYGAFTYHISQKDQLIQYIADQENHHKKITFKEELIHLYKEHGITFKTEYLLE